MKNNSNESTIDKYLLTVNDIQEHYLPISKKKIRQIILNHLDVIRVGGKILVRQEDLLNLLSDHDCERI